MPTNNSSERACLTTHTGPVLLQWRDANDKQAAYISPEIIRDAAWIVNFHR
jgi:hypothetical protein